ncbi:MAG: inorganic phosphate transporter, partial [Gammaproteobacteria bacterium]|nr:inorganic phosphate transporter [Gammaproteobacteria bacterium]
MDSNTLNREAVALEKMMHWNTRGFHISLAFAIAFILGAGLIASLSVGAEATSALILVAACACGYLALNIGANDVSNNVGPAVGTGALSLPAAIAIAIIFSSSGALLAGDSVISTIARDIINPADFGDAHVFIFTMIAALMAAAVWLNISTWLGIPVSTTQAVTGGLLGAAVTAAGIAAVDWVVVLNIAVSWFASPLIGGLISALFLLFVEKAIFSQTDMLNAAGRWIPVLLAVMISVFTLYVLAKSQQGVAKLDPFGLSLIATAVFVTVVIVMNQLLARVSAGMQNHPTMVNQLFRFPLILAAALLSFAHGANDVANAIGPMSAIIAVTSPAAGGQVDVPAWVMIIGVTGICLGLALFATKLVRNVGKSLTSMDQSRAFCVCLAAAITVTGATAAGLPVSSTHIVAGAILGIGFYRELKHFREIKLIEKAEIRSVEFRELVLGDDFRAPGHRPPSRGYRKLVRREVLLNIVLAWVITLPAVAVISGGLFVIL